MTGHIIAYRYLYGLHLLLFLQLPFNVRKGTGTISPLV